MQLTLGPFQMHSSEVLGNQPAFIMSKCLTDAQLAAAEEGEHIGAGVGDVLWRFGLVGASDADADEQ